MDPLTFLCDLVMCLLTEGDHEFNELEGSEQGVVMLPVGDGTHYLSGNEASAEGVIAA